MTYTFWTQLQQPDFFEQFQARSGEGLVHLEADFSSPLVRVHSRPEGVPRQVYTGMHSLAAIESKRETMPRQGRIVTGQGCSLANVKQLGAATEIIHADPEKPGDADRMRLTMNCLATVERGTEKAAFGYANFSLTAEFACDSGQIEFDCKVNEAWVESAQRGFGSGQLLATGIGMTAARYVHVFDEAMNLVTTLNASNAGNPGLLGVDPQGSPVQFKVNIHGFSQSHVMDCFLMNVKNGILSAVEHMPRRGGGTLAVEPLLQK